MSDWDYIYNGLERPIKLRTYHPGYDDPREERFIVKFENLDKEIREISDIAIDTISRYGEDICEDYDIVGILSNSLNNPNRHNIFMEWDNLEPVEADSLIEGLSSLPGIISVTGGGIHYLEKASITMDELVEKMKRFNCCQGYISYSCSRMHACLRVSPKPDNDIIIVKDAHGPLYDIYKKLVGSFKKELIF